MANEKGGNAAIHTQSEDNRRCRSPEKAANRVNMRVRNQNATTLELFQGTVSEKLKSVTLEVCRSQPVGGVPCTAVPLVGRHWEVPRKRWNPLYK